MGYRRVRLITLPPSVSRFPRICGSLHGLLQGEIYIFIIVAVVLLTEVRCSETSRASNGTREDFQSSCTSHPEVHIYISLRLAHEAKMKQEPSEIETSSSTQTCTFPETAEGYIHPRKHPLSRVGP
jgi:hypothetical protein